MKVIEAFPFLWRDLTVPPSRLRASHKTQVNPISPLSLCLEDQATWAFFLSPSPAPLA